MAQLLDVGRPVARQLTARRTLVVVAIALAAGISARAGVLALAVAQMADEQAAAESTGGATGWEGLGTVLLGAVAGVALFVVVAIASVGVGLWRKHGAGRFTALFAVMLLATLAAQWLADGGGLTAVIAAPRRGSPELAAVVIGLSLSWALPAAIVGALRWRWVGVTLVVSTGLALLQSVVF